MTDDIETLRKFIQHYGEFFTDEDEDEALAALERLQDTLLSHEIAGVVLEKARDTYRAKLEKAKEALAELIDVQQYSTGWDNGVTDATGSMNEGDYWHGQTMDKARAVLAELSADAPAQPAILQSGWFIDEPTAQLVVQAENATPAQQHGIFRDHSCWKCKDGKEPCVAGNPNRCEYPHARND